MKTRVLLFIVIGLMSVGLLTGAFTAGFLAGNTLPPLADALRDSSPLIMEDVTPFADESSATAAPSLAEVSETPEDLRELFIPFWESWSIVHEHYVDQPVDDVSLMQGAIEGMLEALDDPDTSYLDPDEFNQMSTRLEGEYEGIGAWVDTSTEYVTIISPMPDSPAENAGLKPGDQIIAVDGEDMTGIDGNLVIRRVLGPAGTEVNLTIRREGEIELLEFQLVRAEIIIKSVESEMLEGDIAYIKLQQFRDGSARELHQAIRELMRDDPTGLILDIRNNGGGLLSSVIEITSEFLPDGIILYQEYGDGSRDIHEVLRGGLATEIPLVVLINEGSASASEILAGAVQDYNRGTLVGTTTFGKGTVQLPFQLSNDQGAIRITNARWLTPSERQISQIGIDPDVEIDLTDEDIAAERDPQLDKAIELLSTGD